MKKFILAVIASAILAGCATTDDVKRTYAPTKIINIPQVNIETEAEIGRTIVSKANLTVYPAVSVNEDTSEFIKQPLMNNRNSGTTTIHAGTFRKTAENSEGDFYTDPEATFKFSVGTIKCVCGVSLTVVMEPPMFGVMEPQTGS